jgi:hypothetical protein
MSELSRNAIEPKYRAGPDEILKFVNKVRDIGQADILDALLPSVPQDSQSCLIARNMNFQCTVSPDEGLTRSNLHDEVKDKNHYHKGEKVWTVTIPDLLRGEEIVEALDFDEVTTIQPDSDGTIADYWEGTDLEDACPEEQRIEYGKDRDSLSAYGLVEFILPARLARAAAAFDEGLDEGYDHIDAADLAKYVEGGFAE